MLGHLANITNFRSVKKILFDGMVLFAFYLFSTSISYAGDPERLNKECPADDLPALTHDANCSDESCQTREGCLDVAPASPIKRISSTFGPRNDPVSPPRYAGSKGHGALDFAAPLGAPIYAAADGTITRSDATDAKGYGNRIQIKHDNGYETLYAHMNCFATYNGERLKVGQKVKKGTVIGFVGNTGSSTGPHLHYEVRAAGTVNKKDPLASDMQGVMCKIPEEFADAAVPPNGTTDSEDAANAPLADRCSVSGCAKMYSADNISELHHKYEAAGDVCAFNNCVAGDIGGCSYGSSQLACAPGSMKNYLAALQKSNPEIWKQLGGGTVEQMNQRACTAPATDFAKKWKAICSTSNKDALNASQENYMKATFYDVAAKALKSSYGIDFNAMSPELQMSLFSASVALGSPGGVKNLMKSIKENIGDPAKMTEEELLEAMYQRRDYFYSNSSEEIRKSVQQRNAREGSEALESLKIRNAWEAEQKKPEDERKSYEEIVEEVTGRKACTGGSSASFNCSSSGVVGGSSSGSYSDKNCSPSQYKATYGGCLLCPLFQVIFNTASTIAKLTFNKLSLPVMVVVLVAWALWMGTQILSFVSSFSTKDAPTLIKTLMGKSLVVLVVVLFLQADSNTFFAMLMEPVFNTGFKLAQMAVSDGACNTQYTVMQDGGLPASMGQSILCTLEAVQGKLVQTMSIGAASMCIGFYVKGSYFIFPSFPYLFSGLLIIAGAGLVIIIFPFLMVESIFQLTVACALLPAAIGAYPFKMTNSYVKHVWNAFMNAIFNFVFLSIVILILTTAIDVTIRGSGLNDLTDENFQESIVTVLVWGGVTLLKIIFVLLLAYSVLDEINEFANQYSSALSDSGTARMLGGMAAKGAKDMGSRAWKGAKSAGKLFADTAKEKIGDARRERQMNNIQKQVKNGQGVMKDILDKDGNVIGKSFQIKSKSGVRGRNVTQTVNIMNNGTKMLETTKDYGNGVVKTTRDDGYLKQVETTENGKVVSSSVSIQTNGLKAIRNKDGSLNMTSLNLALQGSAFSKEMILAAAMKQYAEQSFQQKISLPNVNPENIKMYKDENGKDVIEMSSVDAKDNIVNLKMTMPQGDGNRALVEYNRKDTDGNILNLATDGMINRERQVIRGKQYESYGLSSYYAQRTKYGVDVDGDFSYRAFGNNIESAYDPEELEKIRKRFVRNRQKGKQSVIGGFA